MKKPIIVAGIDPGTESIGMAMCVVTEHGIRMLSPPIQILYSGPLRNGHGTVQVSRRKMPMGHYWDKVNDITKQIGANLALPGYMMEEGSRIDLFDIAQKSARKTSVVVEEFQQRLVSNFIRDWVVPLWEELEDKPVNPPPPLTTIYNPDVLATQIHQDATYQFMAQDIVTRGMAKMDAAPGPAPTLQELADFLNTFAAGRLGNPKYFVATVEDDKVTIAINGRPTMTIGESK